MNVHIKITQESGDNIDSIINALLDLLSEFKKIGAAEPIHPEITLDLSEIRWIHIPVITALAAAIIFIREKGYVITIIWPNESDKRNYLQTIYFEKGLKPDIADQWSAILDLYRDKRYLPIINLPITGQGIKIIELTLNHVYHILDEQLNLKGSFRDAVIYLIDEAMNNIIQHSDSERGWIAAQYYPVKQFIDVVIIDTGVTFLGSYLSHGFQINSDSEAIHKAVNGLSTKIDDENRGFGVRTSRRMLVEGLKGIYCIFSGHGLLINKRYYETPVRWPGTITFMRIPKPVGNFNFYSYVN